MLRLYGQTLKSEQVDPQQAAKFEEDAGRYWDLFYKRNSDRFFKDRHYFDKEWPQLTREHITVLEVGCGAGNSVFPLLEINPASYVYACDFSPRAVELVRAHPAYAETGCVSAFVADITQNEGPGALLQQLPGPVIDYCSMVFVLSAVAPHKMRQALRNVASVLKPGSGRVLFRDYADGDMAQTRLQDSQGVKHIRGNFYARGDGTCCYYFGQDELSAMFASEGFVCEQSLIHARTIENRKSGVKMPRRWVQAVFRYDPAQQPPQPLPVLEEPKQQQQQQQQHEQWQQQQQQQQQQQNGGAQAGPGCLGYISAGVPSSSSSNDSGSSCVSCAGKVWLLPSHLAAVHAGSSSSSPKPCSQQGCCICLAEALLGLVQEQQLQLLGRCVLLAPSWLYIQQQQQQPLATGQQRLLQVRQGAQSPPVVCCVADSNGAHSSSTDAAAAAQQAGGAAALLALVAVWLGARRVYVCLPPEGAGSRQQAAVPGGTEALLEAFHAVLGLNECRVVVERIRPKRWQQGDVRQAAAMQRELVGALERGLPACNGLVVLARASSAAACSTNGTGGAQELLDAVCGRGVPQAGAPLQLVVCPSDLLPGGVGLRI